MSIATQITALQNDKTAIATAIANKGVTVPSGSGFDDFAGLIANIKGYDYFWDTYQQNGRRIYYKYAFAGLGWTEELLNPKYNINFSGDTSTQRRCLNMFSYLNNGNSSNQWDFSLMSSKIDFSEAKTATNLFANAALKNITADFSSCVSLLNTFNCSDGGIIDKLHLKITATTTSFQDTFYYCAALSEIDFLSGSEIAATISFDRSKKLTKQSIQNIIAVLSQNSTGKTLTLSKVAVDREFETAPGLNDGSTSTEWLTLIATKSNWNISLFS